MSLFSQTIQPITDQIRPSRSTNERASLSERAADWYFTENEIETQSDEK